MTHRDESGRLDFDPSEGRDIIEHALVEALRKIANEDYRGPRPWSALVASEALRKYELDLQIGH